MSANRQSIERIYQAYPKKVAKGEALKAIAAAVKRLSDDTLFIKPSPEAWLLAKTQEHAASLLARTTPRKFIPYPASWFNGERYLDDPEEWKRSYDGKEPIGKSAEDRKREHALYLANRKAIVARQQNEEARRARRKGIIATISDEAIRMAWKDVLLQEPRHVTRHWGDMPDVNNPVQRAYLWSGLLKMGVVSDETP